MLVHTQAGFTLAELLIASLLMTIVALGVNSIDVSRLRIQNDLRRVTGATSDEMLTELAVLNIQKNLEVASRVVMLDADADAVWDGIEVRTTTGLDLANPSNPVNYRWDEYRLGAANDLLYFSGVGAGPCAAVTLARQITGLTFAFRNEAPLDPPAGQVFLAGPEDNNVVSYAIFWNSGIQTHNFVGEVTLRMAPYSNLGAANGDSGGGTEGLTAVPVPC